jgi:uncharacterized protein (TIGR03437 family)
MRPKLCPQGWIWLIICAAQLGAQTANWTQQNPQTSPSPRGTPRLAYDSKHSQVVLFSGGDNETWTWDGANWTLLNPAQSPPARSNSNIAYDSGHRQVVVFGGQGLAPTYTKFNDTWLWDGSDWTEAQQIGPSARTDAAMAYDSQHGQVVLFGGQDANGVSFNDTWLWDGSTWNLAHPQNVPPARHGDAMDYDATHGRVVLFGGNNGLSNFGDTWLWDGANWTQVMPQDSPAARCYHQMVYDSVHDQIVLFGGGISTDYTENTGLFNDTWLWDGTNWSQAMPAISPSPRNRFGMAFDAGHAQAVLFGGRNPASTVLGETWTWSGGAVTTPPPDTPVIAPNNGVLNGASFQPGISPGAWITINGTNLSTQTDTWDNFIVNGALPTTLDGVSVMVGDQAAYLEYISPTQINAVAPNMPAGSVPVTVTTPNGTSPAAMAQLSAEQPAFFQWGTYAVATRQNFSLAVKNGTFAGTTTVPAAPGDVIILWGTGFGPTSPSAPVGQETPSTTTYNTATTVSVTVGGKPATVYGAALAPGYAGLYQIAIQIPASLANGDYPVVATIDGISSPSTTLLTVQQ